MKFLLSVMSRQWGQGWREPQFNRKRPPSFHCTQVCSAFGVMRRPFSVYGDAVAPTGEGVSGSKRTLSEVQPRPVTYWSGAGDRTRGEWAWEWAACVLSG